MITATAMRHSFFFGRLAPHLRDNQIVPFSTGHFGCPRHAEKLRDLHAGRYLPNQT